MYITRADPRSQGCFRGRCREGFENSTTRFVLDKCWSIGHQELRYHRLIRHDHGYWCNAHISGMDPDKRTFGYVLLDFRDSCKYHFNEDVYCLLMLKYWGYSPRWKNNVFFLLQPDKTGSDHAQKYYRRIGLMSIRTD